MTDRHRILGNLASAPAYNTTTDKATECRCEYISEESGGADCVCQHCYDQLKEGRDRLLSMLEWLTSFHQDGESKAFIDAEPIKQAKALIKKIKA